MFLFAVNTPKCIYFKCNHMNKNTKTLKLYVLFPPTSSSVKSSWMKALRSVAKLEFSLSLLKGSTSSTSPSRVTRMAKTTPGTCRSMDGEKPSAAPRLAKLQLCSSFYTARLMKGDAVNAQQHYGVAWANPTSRSTVFSGSLLHEFRSI